MLAQIKGMVSIMQIISRKSRNDFTEKHPKDKGSFDAWYYAVKHTNLNSWTDLKKITPLPIP